MRDQVNRLCQWPLLTRKLFALAAKKCFKLNNNLPQELELHFALDLVLVPQFILASHLVDQLLGRQNAVLDLGGHHCGVRVEYLGAIIFKGINEFSQLNASDMI